MCQPTAAQNTTQNTTNEFAFKQPLNYRKGSDYLDNIITGNKTYLDHRQEKGLRNIVMDRNFIYRRETIKSGRYTETYTNYGKRFLSKSACEMLIRCVNITHNNLTPYTVGRTFKKLVGWDRKLSITSYLSTKVIST